MKKKFLKIEYLFLFPILIFFPFISNAAMTYESLVQRNMDVPILDVASNPEADLIFALSQGEVLVLSPDDGNIMDRIPVQKYFEHISCHKEDKLVLAAREPAKIDIIRYKRIYDIDLTDRPFKGPQDAKITLVVFDDYQCPYCARLDTMVRRLLLEFPNDLKYVVKHYPLTNHRFAHKGAMAVLAAKKQGKYWEFHRELFKHYKALNNDKIMEIATNLGLDMVQFRKDLQSSASRDMIRSDVENGKKIGVRGTPSAFLNGKRIENRKLSQLSRLIREELKK